MEVDSESSRALATSRPLDPVAVYVAPLRSRHSRRTILSRLRSVAGVLTQDDGARIEDVPWLALRFHHLAALQAELVRRGFASPTVNLTMTAIRGVLRTAWRMGQLDHETFVRTVEAIRPEPRSEVVAGRMLAREEIAALFRVANLHPDPRRAARDVAMLAIGLGAGLRREEIVTLSLEDVDPDTGSVRVHGKGRRMRKVFVPPSGLPAIRRWRDIRGDTPGAFFCSMVWIRPVICEEIQPLSGQTVTGMLDRLVAEAGISHVSPHDLRRSCASMSLDLGVDLATVQRVLGHASVTTTALYDRRPEAAMRRAAACIDLPIDGQPELASGCPDAEPRG